MTQYRTSFVSLYTVCVFFKKYKPDSVPLSIDLILLKIHLYRPGFAHFIQFRFGCVPQYLLQTWFYPTLPTINQCPN